MRRPAAALLGTVAGTVLLVGAKYGSASPPADAGAVASSDDAAGAASDATSAAAGGAGGAVPGGTVASAPPGRNPTTGAAPGAGTTGRATSGPATTTAACTTASGAATQVASPGVGTVTVTIQVCGGAIKTASAVQSRSNWDPNTAAIPALNKLAVADYKTNFAAIHYSGATLTSTAYRASLRSAMSKAGI